jgi:hypothetical protein
MKQRRMLWVFSLTLTMPFFVASDVYAIVFCIVIVLYTTWKEPFHDSKEHHDRKKHGPINAMWWISSYQRPRWYTPSQLPVHYQGQTWAQGVGLSDRLHCRTLYSGPEQQYQNYRSCELGAVTYSHSTHKVHCQSTNQGRQWCRHLLSCREQRPNATNSE